MQLDDSNGNNAGHQMASPSGCILLLSLEVEKYSATETQTNERNKTTTVLANPTQQKLIKSSVIRL